MTTHTAERESCPLCSVNIWATSAVLLELTAVSIAVMALSGGSLGRGGGSVSPPPSDTHPHTRVHTLVKYNVSLSPTRQVTLQLKVISEVK